MKPLPGTLEMLDGLQAVHRAFAEQESLLLEQVRELRAEVAERDRSQAGQASRIVQLEGELATTQTSLEQVSEAIRSSEERIQQAAAEGQRIQALSDEVAALRAARAELAERLGVTSSAEPDLQRDVLASIDRLQTSADELAAQCKSLNDALAVAGERENRLREAEQRAHAESLAQALDDGRRQREALLRSQEERHAAAMISAEGSRATFERSAQASYERLNEMAVAHHESVRRVAELVARHTEAAQAAEALKSKAQEDLATLRLELETWRHRHDEVCARASRLAREFEQSQDELVALRSSWWRRLTSHRPPSHPAPLAAGSVGSDVVRPMVAGPAPASEPAVLPPASASANPMPLRSTMSSQPPASLEELLALHDEAFVRMAYVTVLGRSPDPDGHNFYVKRVRSGVSKVAIVQEMTLSEEGQRNRAKLAGVDEALRNWKAGPPTLLDRAVHRLIGRSLEPISTDLRRVENAVFRLMQGQQDRTARVESTLSNLGTSLANAERLLEKNAQVLEKLRTERRLMPVLRQIPAAQLDPSAVAEVPVFDIAPRPPDPRPPRRIFFYVDHTISCPTNTGMQRVTRRLGESLLRRGEAVTFVKWNAEHRRFAWIDRDELAFLGRWNGPSPAPEEVQRYPEKHEDARLVDLGDLEPSSWLFVPEVTHITPQAGPMTLNVIGEGRRLGLFLAFVFYDATPLRRPELKAMSVPHAEYMQQLLLVDLILPISAGAGADLCGFLRHYQFADHGPTPRIETLLLPGESQLAERSAGEGGTVPAQPFILSVGSIVPHKNQLALIRAFESYCRRHPGTTWQLRLAGNMHPDLHDPVADAMQREPRIVYLGEVHDDALVGLYRDCSFTAFPSLMEGFGLPILESLWFGKPCVCANFGAMGEVAEGGGCLTVDTSSVTELEEALATLIDSPGRLADLSAQARTRHVDTWADYASTLSGKLTRVASPVSRLGTVYYFVDHTARYEGNTGIQRVTRALARSLLEVGVRLVPVMWSAELQAVTRPTADQLEHLERWNGPKASMWSPWKPVETASPGDWLLVPELTHLQSDQIRTFARRAGLPCSWIFYDAIPWKMQQLYPPAASQAHADYMLALRDVEKVLAISKYSCADLREFLSGQPVRCGDLERHVVASPLPGEFLEAPRVVSLPPPAIGRPVRLLSVGTVEPRKNHLGLLAAFKLARETVPDMELVIAGGGPFQDLSKQVQAEVDSIPGVKWIRKVDDRALQLLYAACDFTIYPSLEEGFGLPILESLWNARPCVCAAFSAMLEVAEGGGCLPVDVADTRPFAKAIASLAGDPGLREQLSREAIEREFRSWRDYALDVAAQLAGEREATVAIGAGAACLGAADVAREMVNLPRRPLLSLCISTYNRAGWLGVSLRNMTRLLPRPLEDVELLVCDNASSDETPEVVKPYLGRADFRYVRNRENVGMLGNLKVTAQAASGKYVWILGDDDLLLDGTIERVLEIVRAHPDTALVYSNYAFTRIDDAKEVTDISKFLRDGEPITPPTPDHHGTVRDMCARSENFFTAIYCLVFRRDHALRAYSQNTSGRPFSTMLTSIPTTYHVLHHMMDERAFWIGRPTVVVNMNVSWMRYASLWILERLPEAFDLAESRGGDPAAIDVWRRKLVASVVHWFRDILTADPEGNGSYVSVRRLVNRMKHLPEFRAVAPTLEAAYDEARGQHHPLAVLPTERVFSATH